MYVLVDLPVSVHFDLYLRLETVFLHLLSTEVVDELSSCDIPSRHLLFHLGLHQIFREFFWVRAHWPRHELVEQPLRVQFHERFFELRVLVVSHLLSFLRSTEVFFVGARPLGADLQLVIVDCSLLRILQGREGLINLLEVIFVDTLVNIWMIFLRRF